MNVDFLCKNFKIKCCGNHYKCQPRSPQWKLNLSLSTAMLTLYLSTIEWNNIEKENKIHSLKSITTDYKLHKLKSMPQQISKLSHVLSQTTNFRTNYRNCKLSPSSSEHYPICLGLAWILLFCSPLFKTIFIGNFILQKKKISKRI